MSPNCSYRHMFNRTRASDHRFVWCAGDGGDVMYLSVDEGSVAWGIHGGGHRRKGLECM